MTAITIPQSWRDRVNSYSNETATECLLEARADVEFAIAEYEQDQQEETPAFDSLHHSRVARTTLGYVALFVDELARRNLPVPVWTAEAQVCAFAEMSTSFEEMERDMKFGFSAGDAYRLGGLGIVL